MVDIPLRNEIRQRREGLVDAGFLIPAVNEIDIDSLRAKSEKACLQGDPQSAPGRAGAIWRRSKAGLGSEDEVIVSAGPLGCPTTDDFLRSTGAIHIRSVDQRAASRSEKIKLAMSFVLTGLAAEGHCSEAEA